MLQRHRVQLRLERRLRREDPSQGQGPVRAGHGQRHPAVLDPGQGPGHHRQGPSQAQDALPLCAVLLERARGRAQLVQVQGRRQRRLGHRQASCVNESREAEQEGPAPGAGRPHWRHGSAAVPGRGTGAGDAGRVHHAQGHRQRCRRQRGPHRGARLRGSRHHGQLRRVWPVCHPLPVHGRSLRPRSRLGGGGAWSLPQGCRRRRHSCGRQRGSPRCEREQGHGGRGWCRGREQGRGLCSRGRRRL
mmetsp:Transcript_691/g.2760  ORF Transcript_691/g.2760 Transcript_691/m.2760 type:complete len:246 (-) Transcript_691:3440-4177(-)